MMRDAGATSALLAARIDELARVLLPQGKAVSGCWRVGGRARGGSLAITLSGAIEADGATLQRASRATPRLVKAVRRCSTPRRSNGRGDGSTAVTATRARQRPMLAIATMRLTVSRGRSRLGRGGRPRRTRVETYLAGERRRDRYARRQGHPLPSGCPWRDAIGREGQIRVPVMIVAMRSIETDEVTAIQRTRPVARRPEDRSTHAWRRRRRGGQARRRRTRDGPTDHWRGRQPARRPRQ